MVKACTTCNKEVIDNYVQFKCPGCSEVNIVRCYHCRETSKLYNCPKCNFEGP